MIGLTHEALKIFEMVAKALPNERFFWEYEPIYFRYTNLEKANSGHRVNEKIMFPFNEFYNIDLGQSTSIGTLVNSMRIGSRSSLLS